MSNYPDGVTGNEFAIAGPDKEWEDKAADTECPHCDESLVGEIVLWASYRNQRWYTCPFCEKDTELDEDEIEYRPTGMDRFDTRKEYEAYRQEMNYD